MNFSTNEVTVATGRYRSYPDPPRPPTAIAPAHASLPVGAGGQPCGDSRSSNAGIRCVLGGLQAEVTGS